MICSGVQFIRFCHFVMIFTDFSYFLIIFYAFSASEITLILYFTCLLAGFVITIFLSVVSTNKELFKMEAGDNDTFRKASSFRYFSEQVFGRVWSQRCIIRHWIRSEHQRIVPFFPSFDLIIIASLHPRIDLIIDPEVPYIHHKALNQILLRVPFQQGVPFIFSINLNFFYNIFIRRTDI